MKSVIVMEIPTQEVLDRFKQLSKAGESLVLMTGYSYYEDFFKDESTKHLEQYIKGTSYSVVVETTNYYVITPSLDFGVDNTGSRVLVEILKELGAKSPVMEKQTLDLATKDMKVTIDSFTFEKNK